MKVFSILILLGSVLQPSCCLITTPVKVVGKAATTTMDVSGKVIGSGIDLVTPGSSDEDNESEKSE